MVSVSKDWTFNLVIRTRGVVLRETLRIHKDVFKLTMDKYKYQPFDILVIRDNPDAEIAAGKDFGIETDFQGYEAKFSPASIDYYGTRYDNLKMILDKERVTK